MASRVIQVHGCQRCGCDHGVEFRPLKNPVDAYNWWGMCYKTEQPVLMKVLVVKEKKK